MSEEEIVNRFLNMIANEYDGYLARQFKNQYLLRYEEIEELQQRIDKAIEFLNNNTMIGHCKEHYELLKILKGEE